jgi:hypothetical protein
MQYPTLVIRFFFMHFKSNLFYLLVQADWDIERLANKVKGYQPKTDEAVDASLDDLRKYFNLTEFGSQNEPCTVVDRHGRIIVWHLPDIIWQPRLVSISVLTIRSKLIKFTGRYQ